jgi:hypothetical protein
MKGRVAIVGTQPSAINVNTGSVAAPGKNGVRTYLLSFFMTVLS